MTPGYRPPMTPWEEREYRGAVWHTVGSAITAFAFVLAVVLLL